MIQSIFQWIIEPARRASRYSMENDGKVIARIFIALIILVAFVAAWIIVGALAPVWVNVSGVVALCVPVLKDLYDWTKT